YFYAALKLYCLPQAWAARNSISPGTRVSAQAIDTRPASFLFCKPFEGGYVDDGDAALADADDPFAPPFVEALVDALTRGAHHRSDLPLRPTNLAAGRLG